VQDEVMLAEEEVLYVVELMTMTAER